MWTQQLCTLWHKTFIWSCQDPVEEAVLLFNENFCIFFRNCSVKINFLNSNKELLYLGRSVCQYVFNPKIRKKSTSLLRPDWHPVDVQGSTNSWPSVHVYSFVQLGPKWKLEESSGPAGAFFLISWFLVGNGKFGFGINPDLLFSICICRASLITATYSQ